MLEGSKYVKDQTAVVEYIEIIMSSYCSKKMPVFCWVGLDVGFTLGVVRAIFLNKFITNVIIINLFETEAMY